MTNVQKILLLLKSAALTEPTDLDLASQVLEGILKQISANQPHLEKVFHVGFRVT